MAERELAGSSELYTRNINTPAIENSLDIEIVGVLRRHRNPVNFVAAILLVAPLCVNTSASRADVAGSNEIAIGVIGDQTGSTDLDNAYRVLGEGVAALNARHVDVVLHTGDLIESSAAETEIRRRFTQATKLLGHLNAPWFLSVGDHDVNPLDWTTNSQDRSKETLFKQLYSALNPRVADHLWYSFDVKSYHFVVLDSLEHLRTDPRWGDVFLSKISDQQFAWLSDDLAKTGANTNGVVVLLHQPLWYNWSDWARVHALLIAHKTRAVIAGHTHYNQVEPPIDGIQYLVVGATGVNTKDGSENAGDLQHVTVLRIAENSISFELLPLTGYSNTQWTDRYIMDRLQAIDVSMGNLSVDPFGIKNGQLQMSCSSNQPAVLAIKNIGNPTDVAVKVKIELKSQSNLQLSDERFGANICEQRLSNRECILRPAANVVAANNSSVQSSYDSSPVFLWTADVNSADPTRLLGATIPIQTAISFSVQNRIYEIKHKAAVTFQDCR